MKNNFSFLSFACLFYSVYLIVLVVMINSCQKEPLSARGQVSTVAGNERTGFRDGSGTEAEFSLPTGVAVDQEGNVYIADYDNHCIRKMTPAGIVSTLAGNGAAGFANGVGSHAQFKNPSGVSVDTAGNVYVADQGNHRIRLISPSGIVSTLAGSGQLGFADGRNRSAQFAYPTDIAVDQQGNVYVADRDNHRIRKITKQGFVRTLAGNGTAGHADGKGNLSILNAPNSVAVDTAGMVYVAEYIGNRIRVISPVGIVGTLAGNGIAGARDGSGTGARFNHPTGIEVDVTGNVYIAEAGNSCIRFMNARGSVSTLAGMGEAGFSDSPGKYARFNFPSSVALDPRGQLYVADANNRRIRRINLNLH